MSDEIINNPMPEPAIEQEATAQQAAEFRTVQNFDWVSDRVFPVMLQAAAMVAIAGAGLLGPVAAVAAGIGLLGAEMGRAYMRNQADMKRELALYHRDIARVLGKSEDEKITMDDMRAAAKELKPLQMELEHLSYRGKYNYAMGAARAVLTAAGAYMMSGPLAQIKNQLLADWSNVGSSLFYPITGALGGIGMATMGAEKIGREYFHSHEPKSAFSSLMRLQEAAMQRPLEPQQVFEAYLKIDDKLAKEIEERLGKPFDKLTFRNKQRVVKATEKQVRSAALAEAINDGRVPVTAVALQAFGQQDQSVLTGYAQPAESETAAVDSWVERVKKPQRSYAAQVVAPADAPATQVAF